MRRCSTSDNSARWLAERQIPIPPSEARSKTIILKATANLCEIFNFFIFDIKDILIHLMPMQIYLDRQLNESVVSSSMRKGQHKCQAIKIQNGNINTKP